VGYRGSRVSVHRFSGLLVAALLGLAALAATATLATAARSGGAATEKPNAGRVLYRKFCGQCHSLTAARAVGFGSNKSGGLGKLGGPSFNEMKVPYAISVRHVTQPTGGHEGVTKKITSTQLHVVARYLANVTRNHPIPALPTDG
jgi:mono/diheme cytochrome c family protein